MDYENVIENTKRDVTYTRLSNNLKDQFEKYLASRHEFLRENEELLKATFKEMYDVEENNLFFESDLTTLLQDCRFNFVEKADFNYKNQPKLREIVKNVNDYANDNVGTIEANVKTVSNLVIISDFYSKTKDESKSIFQSISNIEKNFDPTQSLPELKNQFTAIQAYYQKILKAAQKARKIQLCFSLPDSKLSDLIQKTTKVEVTQDQLNKLANSCKIFMEKVTNETQTAVTLPDSDITPQEVRSSEHSHQGFDQVFLRLSFKRKQLFGAVPHLPLHVQRQPLQPDH